MSEELSNRLLRVTVAQLLQPIGWHGISSSSVQVLSDVLRRYIENIGRTAGRYGEHANRNSCNLDDLAQTFEDYHISLHDMSEFVTEVEQPITSQQTRPHLPFKFPASRPCRHVFGPASSSVGMTTTSDGESVSDEDDAIIPSHLPPIPCREEPDKDGDDDQESGIHVTDGDEIDVGGDLTPMYDGHLKGFPASSRERTLSTDSDLSSEHDDHITDHHLTPNHTTPSTKTTLSPPVAVAPVVVPTRRVIPLRINKDLIRSTSPETSLDSPQDENSKFGAVSLESSGSEMDEEMDTQSEGGSQSTVSLSQNELVLKEIKAEAHNLTVDEIISRVASKTSFASPVGEKKSPGSNKKPLKTASSPTQSRVVAISQSDSKETGPLSGPYKPTVSSKLLTRFTLAKETTAPSGVDPLPPTDTSAASSLKEEEEEDPIAAPPPISLSSSGRPLNLQSAAKQREFKASLSSISSLSSDISSPSQSGSPLGSKQLCLDIEKFPLDSPKQRSFQLDSSSSSPKSQASTDRELFPATALSDEPEEKPLDDDDDDDDLLLGVTTSEDEDTLDVTLPTTQQQQKPINQTSPPFAKELSPFSPSTALTTAGRSVESVAETRPVSKSSLLSLMVSINRKYLRTPPGISTHNVVPTLKPSKRSYSKLPSRNTGGVLSLAISIPREHYFQAMAARDKPKHLNLGAPAVKKEKKMAESPWQPVSTPVDTPSQPIKLRFRLNSDAGDSIPTPAVVAKKTTPQSVEHVSSHKKKKKHKKEKRKRKRKHCENGSSSDSEGIYSEGNDIIGSAPTTQPLPPPILPVRATNAVLPYQPSTPLAICPKCNLPDDGRPMIACDICDKWFHWACVGVVQEPSVGMDWFCPECSREHSSSAAGKRTEHKHKKRKKHSHD